jgi:hypothetical protein
MDKNARFSPHFDRLLQGTKPLLDVVRADTNTRQSAPESQLSNFIAIRP